MIKLIWTKRAWTARAEMRSLDEATGVLEEALDSLRDGTARSRAFRLESRNAFITTFWATGIQFAIVWRRSEDDRPIIVDIGPL